MFALRSNVAMMYTTKNDLESKTIAPITIARAISGFCSIFAVRSPGKCGTKLIGFGFCYL